MADFDRVELHFYARTPAQDGWRYSSPLTPAEARMTTIAPPAVGDLINVPNNPRAFRVVARDWRYPDRGSMNWPGGSTPGPVALFLMLEELEEDEGLFRDEAPDGEDDD